MVSFAKNSGSFREKRKKELLNNMPDDFYDGFPGGAPKPETGRVGEKASSMAAPNSEVPNSEVPRTETQTHEAPVTEMRNTETGNAQVHVNQTLKSETPKAEVSQSEVPASEKKDTSVPSAEKKKDFLRKTIAIDKDTFTQLQLLKAFHRLDHQDIIAVALKEFLAAHVENGHIKPEYTDKVMKMVEELKK